VRTGSRVRIAGQGGRGNNGGPNGDVYLVIKVQDDGRFRIEGKDLRTTIDIPLYTALLGGETVVSTATGRVALSIPKGTQNGSVFRLRGKGLPASGKKDTTPGDLLVTANVVLPEGLSSEEERLFTELRNLRQ
jgi:DnaJ-class molecular chaperone